MPIYLQSKSTASPVEFATRGKTVQANHELLSLLAINGGSSSIRFALYDQLVPLRRRLAATAMIWICQLVFLVYVAYFAQSKVLYGALGCVVLFIVWAYLSSYFGAFGFCYLVRRRRKSGQKARATRCDHYLQARR